MTGAATRLAIYLRAPDGEPRVGAEDFLLEETPPLRAYLGPTPGPILAVANELAGIVDCPAARAAMADCEEPHLVLVVKRWS